MIITISGMVIKYFNSVFESVLWGRIMTENDSDSNKDNSEYEPDYFDDDNDIYIQDNLTNNFPKVATLITIIGGLLVLLGESLVPTNCNDVSAFTTIGMLVIYASLCCGLPASVMILVSTFIYPWKDSATAFIWMFLHIAALVITIVLAENVIFTTICCRETCFGIGDLA